MKIFNIGYDFDLREFTVTEVKPDSAHPLPPIESFKSFADAQAFSAILADPNSVLRFEYYSEYEAKAQSERREAEFLSQLLAQGAAEITPGGTEQP